MNLAVMKMIESMTKSPRCKQGAPCVLGVVYNNFWQHEGAAYLETHLRLLHKGEGTHEGTLMYQKTLYLKSGDE